MRTPLFILPWPQLCTRREEEIQVEVSLGILMTPGWLSSSRALVSLFSPAKCKWTKDSQALPFRMQRHSGK